MSTLYIMESANLFAGDNRPDQSNHLALQEIKLPGIEENFVDHVAGGAPVGIRINTHINPLEATFNLAGWSPNVKTLIGTWEQALQHFTAYGVIRDRLTGRAMRGQAIMWGRLSRANPTAFRKGDLQAHEYAINGLTHYELKMGDDAIYLWDFFTNTLVVGGVDRNADTNTLLSIQGGQSSPGGQEISGQVFNV